MTRDDSTGGWVPMGGGGLSNVSVRKRVVSSSSENNISSKPEYLICGKRISDQSIVLSCTIKKDFQYNKVMPTFHHWRSEEKKFGLTFQTAADATAFDKGVRNAIQDADIEDNDVFMTLELPVDSRSSSGSSSSSNNGIYAYRPTSATSIPGDTYSTTSSPYPQLNSNNQQHLHRIHFIRSSRTMPGANSSGTSGLTSSMSVGPIELQRLQHGEEIWLNDRTSAKEQQPPENDKIESISPNEPYSYVQFARGHVQKTNMESLKSVRPESSSSFKKMYSGPEPPLHPSKIKGMRKETKQLAPSGRFQCRHCLDMFTEEDNCRGSCEYAPDNMLSCINKATCISCAQCLLYHCLSDTEGNYTHHPCSCDTADDHCRRRWTGIALLSVIIPCLWCYVPLHACHRCGVSCGLCGGKHEAP